MQDEMNDVHGPPAEAEANYYAVIEALDMVA
jgi:hypothetical protein